MGEKTHVNVSEKPNFWTIRSARFRITLLCSFTFFGNVLMRSCMGIAMACMVNSTSTAADTTGYNLSACTINSQSKQSGYQGRFNWGSFEQGAIFSSIMLGVVLGSMPAGWLSDRYNSKLLVTIAMVVNTAGALLMPLSADYGGYLAVSMLRFLIGLCGQSIIMPAMSTITARWTPPMERSSVVSIKASGGQIATIIGMPINALLCSWTSFWGGWPLIFYANAIVGLLATVLWIIFGSDRPETYKYISDTEKTFILKSFISCLIKEAPMKMPWLKMLTSPALLSCVLGNFTIGVFFIVMMSYAPTYFKLVLGLNLKSNGALNALPYICLLLATFFFGFTADFLKKKTKLSPTFICKLFYCVGNFVAAASVIGFAFMDCNSAGFAVAFLCVSYFMFASVLCAYLTSMASIAPCFAGMIHSICRFVGLLGDTCAPFIVAAMTKNATVDSWRHVFYLTAALTCFSGIIFLMFGSASLQKWAQTNSSSDMKVVSSVVKSDLDSGNTSETESSTFVK